MGGCVHDFYTHDHAPIRCGLTRLTVGHRLNMAGEQPPRTRARREAAGPGELVPLPEPGTGAEGVPVIPGNTDQTPAIPETPV